jgi:hypothetical protein
LVLVVIVFGFSEFFVSFEPDLGMSFIQYLPFGGILKAIELLLEKLSVSEVTQAVGW